MGETARRIIGLAEEAGRPMSIVATADGPGQELAPTDAAEIRRRLEALAPRPYAPDYAALLPSLDAAVARHRLRRRGLAVGRAGAPAAATRSARS